MSEITTSNAAVGSHKYRFGWLVFFLLVIFVYFFGLTIPLVGPDEPRYAQVAREMLDRSDWVTPTLGGFNWFEKPALLYWLEMVSYKLFGVNEFAARFGPAIFGLGTILSLWILGRFMATETIEKAANAEIKAATSFIAANSVTKDFANWLALIAATTLGIIVFSHGASFDIIITFPITAALVSFFIFDQTKAASFNRKYFPLALFYIFIGIALLAKGLIGIVFPFAIVAFYFVLSRRFPSRTFLFSLVWGTLVALAVASIWYLPMYQRHANEFIDEFFVQHHFQRFTSNKYQHPQPFYFFLWILPLMTLPWLPFFLAAVWSNIRRIVRNQAVDRGSLPVTQSPLLLFSTAWLLVPLAFFSLSGSKLPGYILPSVPAATVLTAIYLYQLVNRSHWCRLTVASIAVATLLVTVGLCIWAVPRFAAVDTVKGLIEAANERGHTSERVLNLHTTSHNAEFYASGRVLRDDAGKQRRLFGAGEVKNEIVAGNGAPVLVLVPLEYLTQLTRDESLRSEVFGDNGELAIVLVALR